MVFKTIKKPLVRNQRFLQLVALQAEDDADTSSVQTDSATQMVKKCDKCHGTVFEVYGRIICPNCS